MLDSVFNRDSALDEEEHYFSSRPPILFRHADPHINAILEDRQRKNALANRFLSYVAQRLTEGDASAQEIAALLARGQKLRKICAADNHPYDPTGRKVMWACSFNGSFNVTTALNELHSCSDEQPSLQAAPRP